MRDRNPWKPQSLDLLIGHAAIAKALGIKVYQAVHLHNTRRIPTFKLNGRVAGRLSEIDAALRAPPPKEKTPPAMGMPGGAAVGSQGEDRAIPGARKCRACGAVFPHSGRGRPPVNCPACRAATP